MTTGQQTFTVDEPVNIDVPETREYTSTVDARLDRKIAEAIDAAEAAGNGYLASLLAEELGSHYFDSR